MLGRLVLLFLLTPAVELGVLIQVDQLIGFWATIALIIVTGVVGSYLARREGLTTWQRLNRRLNAGELPGKELADGVIILVAGALLITPGVLTDVVGFLGLIPFTRAPIRKVLLRWLRSKAESGSAHIQFGMFGGPVSDSSGSASPSNATGAGDATSRWKGQGHRTPRHGSSSTDPPDAPSSPSVSRD